MTMTSIVLVLFLIMDPIGNIQSFLSQLERYSPRKRALVTLREMGFALLLMLFFNFAGELIFNVLDISEVTVRLSSGVILFLVAFEILFPTINNFRQNLPQEEPFFIPLAMPLIAGPSLLATIMLYAHIEESLSVMVIALFIAWLLALLVLLFAGPIHRCIGSNGLFACERLVGMILILLAIQRFMEGVLMFLQSKPSVGA